MKRIQYKKFILVLVMILIVFFIQNKVYATENLSVTEILMYLTKELKANDTVEWDISATEQSHITAILDLSTKTLEISGVGQMLDWNSDSTAAGGSAWKRYCEMIENVKIKAGVENIGEYAFSNCSNLTSVTISNSVKDIGANAFSNCSNLTSINIPDNVSHIGREAFKNCEKLTSIFILGSEEIKLDENVFHSHSTIFCKKDSYMDRYARENSIKYGYYWDIRKCKSKFRLFKKDIRGFWYRKNIKWRLAELS